MRNPNIMLKLIAELLEKAMNRITVEYREEQLKAVKLELEAKTSELASLRETEKGQTHNDEEAKQYGEVRRKNITDILIPFLKDDLETLAAKLDANDAALESIDRLQLQALERIEKLRLDMEELRKAAEERTVEFQTAINDEITIKASEIEAIEAEMRTYAEELAGLVIKKAEILANSNNAKKSIISLESELAELTKTGKFISFKKVIAKAKEDELVASVDALRKRKKLLETKPELLAEDLTVLVKNGASEDEIKEKLATLKTLAGEVKIDLGVASKFGFVAVPLRQTVGELNSQASFYKSNGLGLQQNAINNTILISKTVAGIIYYMELINKAKIVKSQLSKDLQTFEKELTKLPGIRASIKKVEETIARLELAKNKLFEVLEGTIIYNKENTIKQCSSSFMESQAIIGLSQLESNNPNPTAINLGNLDIMETLLSGVYSSTSKEEPENLTEETILTDLEGEGFSLKRGAGALEHITDLTAIDPNSLKDEPVVTPITPEPVQLTDLSEEPQSPLLPDVMTHEMAENNITAPNSEPQMAKESMSPELDIEAQEEKPTEESNGSDLGTVQQPPVSTDKNPIYPASVTHPGPYKPAKEPLIIPIDLPEPPVSTDKNPIYPASVGEYNRGAEMGKIIVPGNEVINARRVTFTGALRWAAFNGAQKIGVKRI